jgi:putative peptidoglycan lipid II flippase
MLYINFATNLFFASFIPNAAAAMRYGNFVALTPLGIISNMILVPFLPVFSRLSDPHNWPELKERLRQGLMLSALTMLPLTAVLMGLASPLVQVIYQRGAFDAQAAQEVAPVLAAYGLGMFFYLGRDVLVRVFYALGDGQTPFRVSVVNIFINACLDFLFYKPFGTVGIVLATVLVNLLSMAIFVGLLHKRLGGLPLLPWTLDTLKLTAIAVGAGLVGWQSSIMWERHWGLNNLPLQLSQLAVSAGLICGLFILGAWLLKIPEVHLLGERLLRRWKKS